MGVLRATVTAVLIITTAATAAAQCVSESRILSTRQTVPNLVAGPIAWTGGALAVAKHDRAADSIFVATYDEQFNQLTGDVRVADGAPDGPLALVWTGSELGLFYRRASNGLLVLQRLTSAGVPIGGPVLVSSRTTDLPREMDVAWSGALNAYVVATTRVISGSRRVFVTILERNGGIRRDEDTLVFADFTAPYLNVAVTESGVIGVAHVAADSASIALTRIQGNDLPIGETVWTGGQHLELLAHDNRFYLVKRAPASGGTSQIRWLVVDTSGRIVGPDRFLVSGIDIDVRPVSLISTGTELALAYLDSLRGFDFEPGSLRLHRFLPNGTAVSNAEFAVGDFGAQRAFSEHDFVWTGRSFITAAVFESGSTLNSFLIRNCPLRVTATTPRKYIIAGDTATFTALPEGGKPGYEFVWDMGDRGSRNGQVVTYRYIRTGTYEVTVTVTDEAGTVATHTITVQVVERKMRAVRK